jgi:hypothetical protein
MTREEFFKIRAMQDFERTHGVTKIPPRRPRKRPHTRGSHGASARVKLLAVFKA